MSELRQRMIREMELRDFAENTQKAYFAAVEGLVRFYMKPPDQLNREQVEDYLLYLKKEKKSPYSKRNQITSGLKFFYNCTLKRDDVRLELPKKNRRAQASGGSRAGGSPQGRRGAGQPEAPGPAEDHVFRSA